MLLVLDQVENPQEPWIGDGGRLAGGLQEVIGAGVGARQHLDADVAVEDLVVRAPRRGSELLVDEVLEFVAVCEHITGGQQPPLAHQPPFYDSPPC